MTFESRPALVFICTDCQRKCFFCAAHLVIYLLNKASFWPDPSHCKNALLFLRICEICGSQIPLPCMAKGSRREADLIGHSGTGRCGEKPEKLNKLPFSPADEQTQRTQLVSTFFYRKTRYTYSKNFWFC